MALSGTIVQTTYKKALNRTTCYMFSISNFNGIWQGENPFNENLPQFVIQLFAMMLVTRTLYLFVKPFHVPLIVGDILGGILLAPSVLGQIDWFPPLFPLRSLPTIDTLSYIALAFYVFLQGLWIDLKPVKHTNKRTITIAATGIVVPMLTGICLYFLTKVFMDDNRRTRSNKGCYFWGLALSITSFPIVTKILADLKLLHTEIGNLAMSAAIVTDLCSWIFVSIAVPIVTNPNNAPGVVSSSTAFILICVFVVRPLLVRLIHQKTKRNHIYDEFYLCSVLIGVVLCSFGTDLCGTNPIMGAFVFGLIWPDRELGAMLLDRFEDFVSGILLPAFFAICGLKISVDGLKHWEALILVLIFSCGVKVLSTFLVSYFYQMNMQDGLSLGVIMNTKGILALVVLNQGWDNQFLGSEEYAVMLIAILIMTAMVGPIINRIYRPVNRVSHYKFRTIQMSKPESDLRILACLHSKAEVHGMINLLDLTNEKKPKPTLSVFALHLVELTGCKSVKLIAQDACKGSGSGSGNNFGDSQSEEIMHAFETYKSLNNGITAQVLTAVTPMGAMHQDICNVAEDKRVSFMILPYHEQKNTGFRSLNQNVLVHAPCSVGIFVDRGLVNVDSFIDFSNNTAQHIAMIFIGGPDDREALAFAWRIVSDRHHQAFHYLTVFRFLPSDDGDQVEKIHRQPSKVHSLRSFASIKGQERTIDDEYVNEFRLRTAGEQHVCYIEKLMNNNDKTLAAIEGVIRHNKFDLYIAGRGNDQETDSSTRSASFDWSSLQELGIVGNLLVSSDVECTSVLVVQQYYGVASTNALAIDVADASGGSPMADKVGKFELYTKNRFRVDDSDDDDALFH